MPNIFKKKKQEVAIQANIKKFRLASWVEEVSEEMNKVREYVKTGNEAVLNALKASGAVLDFDEDHNIIVTAGFNVLARLLAGEATYTGEINYGALGTGASPSPALSSTQLATEAFRKLASSQSYDANKAYVDFFYAATDWDGTATEFGNFIDGTASANSGQMFSYLAAGGWVKSATESLFVSCEYTLT